MSGARIIANRFEIQDLLGRGGMGEVYRAMEKNEYPRNHPVRPGFTDQGNAREG